MADDPPDELAARRARQRQKQFGDDLVERLRSLGIVGVSSQDAVDAIRRFQWDAVPDTAVHPNCRCTAVYLEEPSPYPWWRRAIAWVRTRRTIWRIDRWAKRHGLRRR